jgi:hypothetical protein
MHGKNILRSIQNDDHFSAKQITHHKFRQQRMEMVYALLMFYRIPAMRIEAGRVN